MSLQLVLAGLYPPKGTALEWNKNLNWQPIPFNYEELDNDSLLLVRQTCPRYHEELKRVFAEDIIDEMDDNFGLFQELSNSTGWKIKTPGEYI
jgi:prostatic aicd phosphatase